MEFRREISVPHLDDALDLDRCAHRVQRRRELRQQAVPSGVHHAPPVLAHQHRDRLAVVAERPDGGRLILRHEAAVADHVGRQDGGQPARNPALAHPEEPSVTARVTASLGQSLGERKRTSAGA